MRFYLGEMSFKDVLEELSAYLSYKNPPKCVFKMEKALNLVFHEIGYKGLDKMDIWFKGCMGVAKRAGERVQKNYYRHATGGKETQTPLEIIRRCN